ncbi:MAG: high frequency lysogenization protein HflD [Candidatus Competibacteraceae bacterium]|uniref:High frequency lysogenization protein HflD homolog n=1 Tax=Candidatus Contendobacter odensis Run_B_J11 TaxID=1400861 RepID=A0A7U7GFN6_9GAMM|nr:high frequency lysogenization protein HflD [Candidatus Contendobacter odensis]MBK8537193.1 high frequency lysogenization protein HflD [Candidatus Competibacteraceae bacterium]MBK8754345.1 high frequency lysogenization protein HflD [Candidatus Competibacteraceae bacterium]CDH47234.1 High frequency lysogenization protein HflD homolog [Candidatus Contendobacter odensis Run_B_J11]
MPQTDHDRVIALAGVVQAADLVRAIAQRGQANPEDVEACLASLLKIDATSSAEIYGGATRLRSGLRLLELQLNHPQDMELTRYVVALLGLERKLARQPGRLQTLRDGIEEVIQNLSYFPVDHSNTTARFADLYLNSLSTLSPRIMVNGDPANLNNPENANRIRALLLAGIRAAMLWRQSGGGRLTLLLRRNPLLRETRRLLTAVD